MASPIGLLAVVSFVAADFEENGCQAKVLFGPAFVGKNAAPNQVVFVATSDTYGAPARIAQNPQAILTRNVGCEAHIWGAAPKQADSTQQYPTDQAVCDALVNQTLLSLTRANCPVGVQINTGTQRYDAINSALGAAYVLQFTIQVPVLRIRFPELGITEDVLTWRTVDPVEQDVTVDLVEPA